MSQPLSSLMRRKTDSTSARDKTLPVYSPSESQIFEREAFVRMLSLERKRTQRSGRPFVLMLLEAGALLKAGSDERALQKVLQALSQSIRETDIKGWYEEGEIIGVIFTEIDRAQGRAVANALLSRVSAALASTLGIEDINEIRLSFHIFPEESNTNGNGNGNQSDPFLYPDLEMDMDRKKAARILKRAMDITGSLCALFISAPLLMLIASAVKLTTKGPVIFRQQRVGQYGRSFTFLKFRSMYTACDPAVHMEYMRSLIRDETSADAGKNEGPHVFKLTNDPRVTPIGRLLRRSSLDELPQFFNVFKGDMSLVGPRPAIPYEVKNYDIWHRQRIFEVKPGITGLWQVAGRSRTKFADMVRLDLQYAKSWSLWLDIKILLRTPRAVISREGAY